MRRSIAAAAFAAAVGLAPEAWACSTCACGDPTLTVMGAEQPFGQRLRAAALVRTSGQTFGSGAVATELREVRTELSLAYAPTAWLMVSLTTPLVRRVIDFPNLARDTTLALGDLELRVRAFLWRDRSFRPRHLIAALAGLELPTARSWASAGDDARPVVLQVGSGSFDPLAGATYSYFGAQVSFHAVSTVLVPTRGFEGARQGLSWRTSLAAQYQPWSYLGLRIGADARVDRPAVEPGGSGDPNSGGLVGFATVGLVSSVLDDLVVQASLSLPVVQQQRGEQAEALAVMAGVTYDL